MFIYPVDGQSVVRQVTYGSPEYDTLVDLRYEILRKPLNLVFTPEQLAKEAGDILLGFFTGTQLVGCLILTPEPGRRLRMKQVAVSQHLQKRGIGRWLVLASEDYALRNGYETIYCHARDTAVTFYLKLGYILKGESFIEVGIPHRYMEKPLISAGS